MDYTILYIDEDQSAVNRFIRYFESDFIIKEGFYPDITLEKLIPVLDNKEFDFLVVDSNLNEKSGCGFDGQEILKYFTKKFPHFPVILFTNYDDKAVIEIQDFDINKIYSKRELTNKEDREVFIKKLKRMIDEYREQNDNAESRITKLIDKKNSGETLNAAEEDEIIKLDTFLDETLDGDTKKIPDQIKESNEEKIDLLLNKTDELIIQLKKYEEVSK